MLDFQVGDVIGNRYEIKKVLGVGGMGKVFRARQIELGRDVALKVPSQAVLDNPEVMARFSREAKTVGKLLHDNIVQVYEYYYEEGLAFIAMEYVEGADLKGLVTKPPKDITVGDVATIIEMSCEGLSFAHDNHIIHRDIKPHNIMVARLKRGRWKVKVMDFGIAHIDPAGQFTEVGDGQLTQTGQALGTPSYMAPEQIRGVGVSKLSDIYSIGCVIFYVFARKTIFSGSGLTVAVSHLNEQPPSLLSELPKLPVGLDKLVNQCLEKDPEKRPQDATEVGNMICEALQDIWDQPMTEFWKENLQGQAPIPLAGKSPAEVDEDSSSFGESGKLVDLNTGGTVDRTMDQDSLLASQENTIVDPQQSRMAQGTRQQTMMTDPTVGFDGANQTLPTKEMASQSSAGGGTMPQATASISTDAQPADDSSKNKNVILFGILTGIVALAVGLGAMYVLSGGDDDGTNGSGSSNNIANGFNPEETVEPEETQVAVAVTPDIDTGEEVIATPSPTPSPTPTPTPEPTPSPIPTPSPTPFDVERNRLKIITDTVKDISDPLELAKTWNEAMNLVDSDDEELTEEVLKLTDNIAYKMATNPDMQKFPSGAFTIGTNDGDPDERPINTVRLSGFELGRYEVSALEFAAFLNSNQTKAKNLYPDTSSFNVTFDNSIERYVPVDGRELHPANGVSWTAANAYANWLFNETASLYSLPTEAQWECGARGRSNNKYPWGNLPPNSTLANYNGQDTVSIDSFSAGLQGLYNLSGNVSEWVLDWYDADAYESSDRTNPTGPTNDEAKEKSLIRKVHRGGDYFSYADEITVSKRLAKPPDTMSPTIGFRLALNSTD